MGYEVTGTVRFIGETEQISERFSKRTVRVEHADNPEYPQVNDFELINKACSYADKVSVGDEVKVDFDLRGREYTKDGATRVFNSLNAWRLVKVEGAPQQSTEHEVDNLPF